MSETKTEAVAPSVEDVAAFAAKWWADFLRAAPVLDNGESAGGLAGALVALHAASYRPEPAQVDRFEELLRARVLGLLATGRGTHLSCDYDPSQDLRECAIEAGIEDKIKGMGFPWKTSVYVHPRGVFGSQGYGQAHRAIFGLAPVYGNSP